MIATVRALLGMVCLFVAILTAPAQADFRVPVLRLEAPAQSSDTVPSTSVWLLKVPGLADQIVDYAADGLAPADLRVRSIVEAMRSHGLQFVEALPAQWTRWDWQPLPLVPQLDAEALRQVLLMIAPGIQLQKNVRYRTSFTDRYYDKQWALKNTGAKLHNLFADAADEENPNVLADGATPGIDIGAEGYLNAANLGTVRVAVIDTGVAADTKDLIKLVDKGYDLCEDDADPDDDLGHGTRVASLIAAKANNDGGNGIIGVAPNVRIVPFRALGAYGVSEELCNTYQNAQYCECNSTLAVSKALQRAIDAGVDVINMSLAGEESDSVTEDLIRDALQAGISVVVAAGNEAQDLDLKPTYPASYDMPGLLTVAAHTNDGNRASFSNFGSVVDVAAPGVNVIAAGPGYRDAFVYNNWGHLTLLQQGEGVAWARLDVTYVETYMQGDTSDFLLDIPPGKRSNWGVIYDLAQGHFLVLDIDALANGEEGYTGNTVGTWRTNNPVTITDVTLLSFYAESELAEGDVIRFQASDNGASWITFYELSGDSSFDGSFRMDEIFAGGGVTAAHFRIEPAISKGADKGLAGGAFISSVRLLERYPEGQNEAHIKVHDYQAGTSFAAPMVAGAVAHLRALAPGMDPPVVEALIKAGAEKLNANSGIPANRRLYLPGSLQVDTALLFESGITPFENYPYTAHPVETGTPVTFEIGYLDPKNVTYPTEVYVTFTSPAATETTLAMALQRGSVTTGLYYRGVTTFSQPETWKYEFFATDVEGNAVVGPQGTFLVRGPTIVAEDEEETGCGCQVTGTPGSMMQVLNLLLVVLGAGIVITGMRRAT